jgi:integrase/recombinase XerD
MTYKTPELTPPVNPYSLEAYAQTYRTQLFARGYATQTVEYKYMSLCWFITWCRERGLDRIEQITRPVLQRYQRHLYLAISRSGKPLSIAAQRNRLTAVRTWFRFLMRENLILTNPASELELPKQEYRLPKHILTADEAEQVLQQPDTSTSQGIRDRAILEVLYSTGIRRQELINLGCHDLNTGAGVLAVRQGKGKKDRFVPIGERALLWVDKYRQEVREQQVVQHGILNLFVDSTGKEIDPHHISRAIKKYIKQSGVRQEGSCHLFRHTMATLMLENGADIRFIQHILGHSMLSTTEIYTHVAIHKLKEVHTLTHPAKLQRTVHTTDEPAADVESLFAVLDAECEEENEDD